MCSCVLQFTQDFIQDCTEMTFAYFSDATRLAKLLDPIEEEVVHHGYMLQRSVAVNATLVVAAGSSARVSLLSIAG